MTASELAKEVWNCLPPEAKKRIEIRDVKIIVALIFETIAQQIMLGDSIRIRNFGRIWAEFTKGGKEFWCEPVKRMVVRKPNIKIKFTPARRLKRAVGLARSRMRALARKDRKEAMEKYGYEQETKDPKSKTASESGKCPKCGSALKGNPPVCPKCGSEPFEKSK